MDLQASPPQCRRLPVILAGLHLSFFFSTAVLAREQAGEEPHVLFHAYDSCAQVCLYSVAQLKERNVTWSNVKQQLPTDGDGQHNFAQIADASRQLGIAPVSAYVDRWKFQDLPTPAIVHYSLPRKDGTTRYHYAVVVSSNHEGVYELDPPSPVMFVQWKDFEKAWTGNAMFFASSGEEMRRIEEVLWSSRIADFVKWTNYVLSILVAIVLGSTFRSSIQKGLIYSWAVIASASAPMRSMLGRLDSAFVVSLVILVLSVFVITAFLVKATSSVVLSEPALDAPGEVVDLGEYAPGVREVDIELRNVGEKPLAIKDVKSSCACAVVNAPSEIPPNGMANVRAQISVRPGPRRADLLVVSNDPRGPQRLTLQWHGTAEPILYPPRIVDTNAAVGKRYERIVQIMYPGGPSAITPEIVRVECDDSRISVQPMETVAEAVQVLSASFQPQKTLGAIKIRVSVDAPFQTRVIDSMCRFLVKYGQTEQDLKLRIKVCFQGAVIATPDTIAFSALRPGEIIGDKRRVRLRFDKSLDAIPLRSLQFNSPEWLQCRITRDSEHESVLEVEAIQAPSDDVSQIVVYGGGRKAAAIAIEVVSVR